jgi:hypothetical protein
MGEGLNTQVSCKGLRAQDLGCVVYVGDSV